MQKVLLGQFLKAWAEKNRHHSKEELAQDDNLNAMELQPFESALIAMSDEKAFNKAVNRFVRRKTLEEGFGMSVGGSENFSNYLIQNTGFFAGIFLSKFDTTRQFAERNAVNYLLTVAVNWFLRQKTKPINTIEPNLEVYLDESKSLSERTRLAVKLAIAPALLTDAERQALFDKFGLKNVPVALLTMDEIAAILGYKNGAAVSRKLYRVLKWCRGPVASRRAARKGVNHE